LLFTRLSISKRKELDMRKFTIAAVLAAFLATPMLVGCEREVSHTEKTTKNPDGTTSKSEETVKKNADGSTTVEKKRSTNDTSNP
jgi:hypothetical protein